MILTQPEPRAGLGPLVEDERDRPVEQRQHDLAAVPGHVAEAGEVPSRIGRVQIVAPPLFEGLDRRLELGRFFRRRDLLAAAKVRDLPDELAVRVGMHGHGRVAEHGLGPRRGHDDVLRLARLRVDDGIAQVPEVPLDLLVDDLVVARRRSGAGSPS